jgi:hypothetical protein
MQAKLIVTFDRLSASDFLVISGSMVNAMTNNSQATNLRRDRG